MSRRWGWCPRNPRPHNLQASQDPTSCSPRLQTREHLPRGPHLKSGARSPRRTDGGIPAPGAWGRISRNRSRLPRRPGASPATGRRPGALLLDEADAPAGEREVRGSRTPYGIPGDEYGVPRTLVSPELLSSRHTPETAESPESRATPAAARGMALEYAPSAGSGILARLGDPIDRHRRAPRRGGC
jgi:hypothetical protein